MSDLLDTFDALYSRLILRDVVGKVVPGFILLAAVTLGTKPHSLSLSVVENLSIMGWVLLYGFGWLAGFAVQAFADRFRLIVYYPSVVGNPSRFYSAYREFDASATPTDRQQLERFVVIKEACGNGYVAIAIGCFVVAINQLVSHAVANDVGPWLLSTAVSNGAVIAVLVAAAVFLRHFHLEHAERQWSYMEVVRANKRTPAEEEDRMKPHAPIGDREAMLVEYQAAQDSAQFNDLLVWTSTGITWGLNVVLFGFALSNSHKPVPAMTAALLGVLLVVFQPGFLKVRERERRDVLTLDA